MSLSETKKARDLVKGDRVLGNYGAHTVQRVRTGYVFNQGFHEDTVKATSVMIDWSNGEWETMDADKLVPVATK